MRIQYIFKQKLVTDETVLIAYWNGGVTCNAKDVTEHLIAIRLLSKPIYVVLQHTRRHVCIFSSLCL